VKGYEAIMPRLRTVPWMLALDAALVLRDLWGNLEGHERRRLAELVRKGRSMNEREKAELKRLVGKLELLDTGRRLVPLVGKRRRRRR
jgi:hypothetical protein